jgi:hypothetical protein
MCDRGVGIKSSPSQTLTKIGVGAIWSQIGHGDLAKEPRGLNMLKNNNKMVEPSGIEPLTSTLPV